MENTSSELLICVCCEYFLLLGWKKGFLVKLEYVIELSELVIS